MRLWAACVVALVPGLASAQVADVPPAPAGVAPLLSLSSATEPIDLAPFSSEQRVAWIVDSAIGSRSLGVGVLASAWQTHRDSPHEWDRTWSGFGKRYGQAQADTALSAVIEGGVGAIWSEDPRYRPSEQRGVWSRLGHATQSVVIAPRRNGRLAPAWGRMAGSVFNNVIENAWLPRRVRTPRHTIVRSADSLLARLARNVWAEFWPDLRKRLGR